LNCVQHIFHGGEKTLGVEFRPHCVLSSGFGLGDQKFNYKSKKKCDLLSIFSNQHRWP